MTEGDPRIVDTAQGDDELPEPAPSSLLDRAKTILHQIEGELWSAARYRRLKRRRDKFLTLIARILFIVVTGFRRERIKLRAGALTYVTLLSLVPALAVVFWLISALGGLEGMQGRLKDFILAALTTQSHRVSITGYLDEFVSQANIARLGGVGMGILVFTVISLLSNIEKSFNDIWGLRRDRTLLKRFQVYWPIVTLGPLMLGASLSLSAALEANTLVQTMSGYIGGFAWIAKLLPLVLAWFFFTLVYLIMPATKVPLKCAAIGGVVAGSLWVLAQSLYALYASNAITYSAIYGSLGAVPLFFLWIYVSWIVALLGAQLTFAIQSAETYEPERERNQRVPQREQEFLASRLIVAVSHAFAQGKGPVPEQVLIDSLMIPPRVARGVLAQLADDGLLVEAGDGYIAGRPLDQITIGDVIATMRGAVDDDPAHLAGADPLSKRVSATLFAAEHLLAERFAQITLEELVSAESEDDDRPDVGIRLAE